MLRLIPQTLEILLLLGIYMSRSTTWRLLLMTLSKGSHTSSAVKTIFQTPRVISSFRRQSALHGLYTLIYHWFWRLIGQNCRSASTVKWSLLITTRNSAISRKQ